MNLVHKVRLKLFKDNNATGDYGVLPVQCEEQVDFIPFWNGTGIFHDVFEHWFEDIHKYFRNDYAFNQIGEICAMGACSYYWNDLGIYNREINPKSIYTFNQGISSNCKAPIKEAIFYGNSYTPTLECNIPYQQSPGSYCLNEILEDIWYSLKEAKDKGYNVIKIILQV